jgi:hypothetical protein
VGEQRTGVRTVFETYASGIDEDLQGVGGDPWSGISATGLRIPTLATPTPNTGKRYIFTLGGFELGEAVRARITGWRQLLTLGTHVVSQQGGIEGTFEMEVTNPAFRLPDANVSYHIMRAPLNTQGLVGLGPPPLPILSSLAFRFSQSPALLYDTGTVLAPGKFYVNLTAYVPPNAGQPVGEPVAHLRSMTDKRTPWGTASAWSALGIDVEGPGFYGLYASVAQTSGVDWSSFAAALTASGNGVDEYRFVAAFPPGGVSTTGVKYWRVGGALEVEIYK